MRFSSTRLLEVSVEGVTGDCVFVGNPFVVSVKVDPGKLEPEEIMAELVIGRRDGQEFIGEPDCVPLTMMGKDAAGILTFTGVYIVKENGPHLYGVRVLPYNRSLASKQEVGLVLWG
jgi:phosphorylase/glycogen(starch) synthase